jgi:hypothetical protein
VKTVIGIDPSSVKLAFAITSPKGNKFFSIKLNKSKDKQVECVHTYNCMLELLSYYQNVYVYLEAPVGGRGGFGSTIPQAKVSGAIMAACGSVQRLMLVNNKEWKRVTLHYGNPSKLLLQTRLRTRWPEAYEGARTKRGAIDQDIVDASWLNIFGRIMLNRQARRSVYEAEKEGKS